MSETIIKSAQLTSRAQLKKMCFFWRKAFELGQPFAVFSLVIFSCSLILKAVLCTHSFNTFVEGIIIVNQVLCVPTYLHNLDIQNG